MKKMGRVDSKVRIGGSDTIGHGAARESDVMHPADNPAYRKHVNRVPADVAEFDQHHGNATAETGDHYGSSKE